jgi:uncharacterized protein DUF4336
MTYPPLDTLKEIAEGVWIVDGPTIDFGPRGFRMPFPTRMTVIRLPPGDLFVHSPTRLTSPLRREIEAIGLPRWIIGPNRLHYWWIPEWHEAYPAADVYVAPKVSRQAGDRIDFATRELAENTTFPWKDSIATLALAGSYMTEFEFFHHSTRTLVLTDCIENFEAEKLHSPWMRWLARLGGALDPDGQTPRDLRQTFRRNRAQIARAVDQMIAWNPARIILAHGRWYDSDATSELKRAFRWVR